MRPSNVRVQQEVERCVAWDGREVDDRSSAIARLDERRNVRDVADEILVRLRRRAKVEGTRTVSAAEFPAEGLPDPPQAAGNQYRVQAGSSCFSLAKVVTPWPLRSTG
jgi:hypothetical protein